MSNEKGELRSFSNPTTIEIDDQSDVLPTINALNSPQNMQSSPPPINQQILEQQILQIKKQQQMQHQMLVQHFQAQQQQLAEQHEAQIRQHLKYWQLQKQIEEQQRAEAAAAQAAAAQAAVVERNKLIEQQTIKSTIKKDTKPISEPPGMQMNSAMASSEVKQKLQSFLMRKQRDAASSNNSTPTKSLNNIESRGNGILKNISYKNCYEVLKQQQSPNSNQQQTYQFDPGSEKSDKDFSLRKTASEPNLLKVRIKQRVMERRSSPMVKRHDRLLACIKKKSQISNCIVTNDNSVSSTTLMSTESCSPTSVSSNAPIKEEEEECNNIDLRKSDSQSSVENSLFSSPSMPNIPIGTAIHLLPSPDHNSMLPTVNEAQFRARLGLSQIGIESKLNQKPTIYGSGQNVSAAALAAAAGVAYQSPLILSNCSSSESQASSPRLSIVNENHIDEVMAEPPLPPSLNRLKKHSIRPLGRTQSSPLPLAHPVLVGGSNIPTYQIVNPNDPNSYLATTASFQNHCTGSITMAQPIHSVMLTPDGRRIIVHQQQQQDVTMTDSCVIIPPEAHVKSFKQKPYRILKDVGGGYVEEKVIDLTGKTNGQELLQHQRDLIMRNNKCVETVDEIIDEGETLRHPCTGRPLARALSSPLVGHHHHYISPHYSVPAHNSGNSVGLPVISDTPNIPMTTSINLSIRKRSADSPHRITTGVAFDNLMLKHSCICGNNLTHPEHAGRLQSIWARLMETGLISRCDRMRARKATIEELQTCHTEVHALLFGTNPLNRQKMDMNKITKLPVKSFVRLSCGGIGVDADTTWNEIHTAPAARMAAGCMVELSQKCYMGDIKNGFAIVRPPGHHAEPDQAMGFCFFNSIGIAARVLQQRFSVNKILVVDWDVHHGNGTQQIFYDDPRVLFISIHRHDDGNFFPGTGSPTECGVGPGLGFNINIAWSGGLNPPLGDAEYLAAFRSIVIPIAKEFQPEIILVSAGFDASVGHLPPLGGYKLSAACFGFMTKQLMQICNGKLVLALEGGYDLPAICDSSEECVRVLLGDEPSPISNEELLRLPCQNAIDTLQKTIAIQLQHWPCIKRTAHIALCSHIDAIKLENEECETVTAMASLSMKQNINNNNNMTCRHSAELIIEPMENSSN